MTIELNLISSLALALMLGVMANQSHAEELVLEDCDGIAEMEISAEQKVERLYQCIGILASQRVPANVRPYEPKALVFKKPVTYGPTWSTYNGYRNFEFAQDSNGLVHLRGMMAGCPSTENAIFKLPAGHRPKEGVRLIFSTMGGRGNDRARVDITHDGSVFFYHSTRQDPCPAPVGTSQQWLTLEGLTFMGEQ